MSLIYFLFTFQIDNNAIPNCPPPLPTLPFEPRFTIAKVKTLLRKLNPKSAGGPDRFHSIFFKNFNESLSQPLDYSFSLSYAHSFLPTSWRHAYITPIFKKGDPSCSANLLTLVRHPPSSSSCLISAIITAMLHIQILA